MQGCLVYEVGKPFAGEDAGGIGVRKMMTTTIVWFLMFSHHNHGSAIVPNPYPTLERASEPQRMPNKRIRL